MKKTDPQEQIPTEDTTQKGKSPAKTLENGMAGWFTTSRTRQIVAVSSALLVVVTALLVVVTAYYTEYARQQVILTRDVLKTTKEDIAKNTDRFDATLREMKEQTKTARQAADVAKDASVAAQENAEFASEQVAALEKHTNAVVDSVRLDQRAWLGYHKYVIQARESTASNWVDREPEEDGEQFRVRFYVRNVGKTPAFNVRVMSDARIVPTGRIPDAPESNEWTHSQGNVDIFPGDESINHGTSVLYLREEQFSQYSNFEKEIFLWAKLSYCDVLGGHHWAQIGVAHRYRSSAFNIRFSSVSPDPGEKGHPDCRNINDRNTQ